MKLFTKDIDKKLFQQYQNGSDLDSQVAVTKIFNPYGNGRWFLLNSDPQDPDYLWAIVQMGDIVEVGSVLRSELESVRVSPFKFPLERDLGFTMVNAGELYRGLQEGKFYQKGGSLMAAAGMEVGRYYKDKNGDTYRYIGENSQRQTLFNDGQKVIVKSIEDFEEEPKNNKLFGIFEDGGKIDTIPDDYKYIGSTNDYKAKFVNKHDGSILEVDNFEIDPISKRIVYIEPKEALMKYFEKNFADGGFVDKTDEELKGMTDDELFEYLDAKAAYMKQYARPLSSFKAKNYAANSVAIQFQNEGTDKLDANFPSLSKINQQATKDYEETIAKRNKMAMGGKVQTPQQGDVVKGFGHKYLTPIIEVNEKNNTFKIDSPNYWDSSDILISFDKVFYSEDDNAWVKKMAKGGMMEHGLRIGDKVTTDMFWDNKIVVENVKTRKRAEIDLDNGKRKDEMAMGGVIKVGDTIKIKDGLKGKLMNVEGKNLEVKKITEYEFPSGIRKFYHVEDDGYIYDVREDLIEHKKMAKGGKVKFQDKVKAIKASLLKTKKVPKKVQKDYGKTYNAKEAELAAKRIAGAMAKKGIK
jgi:hypothetical protein